MTFGIVHCVAVFVLHRFVDRLTFLFRVNITFFYVDGVRNFLAFGMVRCLTFFFGPFINDVVSILLTPSPRPLSTVLLYVFRSSHFSFLVFGHFWRHSYENTKILCNLCLHFARQDGQDGKKTERKSRNQSDQNTKNQKTKIWDERNILLYIIPSSVIPLQTRESTSGPRELTKW